MSKVFDNIEAYTSSKGRSKTYVVHTELPSSIDARKIKCSCNNKNCKIGLNFDDNIMFLTNKLGNETAMHLDLKNIDEIIGWLKQIKKGIK